MNKFFVIKDGAVVIPATVAFKLEWLDEERLNVRFIALDRSFTILRKPESDNRVETRELLLKDMLWFIDTQIIKSYYYIDEEAIKIDIDANKARTCIDNMDWPI